MKAAQRDKCFGFTRNFLKHIPLASGQPILCVKFQLLATPMAYTVNVGTKSFSENPVSLFLMSKCAGAKVNALSTFAFHYFPPLIFLIVEVDFS
jgi:hypothetical protein